MTSAMPQRREIAVASGPLLVTLPFPIVGTSPSREVGPCSRDLARPLHGETVDQTFQRRLAPRL